MPSQEGCGELFDSGQEFLDRVAISLGGKALVPAAGALLPAWLQDAGDWKKRHAALICLAQVRLPSFCCKSVQAAVHGHCGGFDIHR